MLTKARQKKYFDKRWKMMQKHLLLFYKSQNPEELHRIRIEIKKINALLFFIKVDSKNKNPLKKIFKHAGLVRNIQINLQLMGKYKITDKQFKKDQQLQLNIESKKFLQNYFRYNKIIKKEYEIILGDLHSIKNKYILKMYKNQLKKINLLLAKKKSNKELHTCRKKIKKLIYVHEVLDKSLADKLKLNIPYLFRLQTIIGRWHDAITSYKTLKAKKNVAILFISGLENKILKTENLINILSQKFSATVFLQ